MARRDRLVQGDDARCGCDCGDCGGAPPIPLALRPIRRRWVPVLQLLVALAVAFIAGTLGCALTDWWAADAQTIQIDTSTAQYKQHRSAVDSLAAGPVVFWAARFRLAGWIIVVRADTLGGDTIAYVHPREELRRATITFDMRALPFYNEHVVVVHELLHVKWTPVSMLAKALANEHAGITKELMRKEEGSVIDISQGIVEAWAMALRQPGSLP